MDESPLSSEQRKEVALYAKSQLDAIKNQIALNESSDGEFYIPDISWAEPNDPRIRLLSWLLRNLAVSYPQFVWQQTEYHTQKGMLIRWKRK